MIGLAVVLAFSFAAWSGIPAASAKTYQSVDSWLPGDGHRYVAFRRPDGVPVVFDTRDQVVREITNADGCWPTSVGGGRVVLSCDFQEFPGDQDVKPVRLASVRGGASVPIVDFNPNLRYGYLGKYWIKVSVACQGGQCGEPPDIYLNLKTGRVRTFGARLRADYRNMNSKNLDPVPEPCFIRQIRCKGVSGYCYSRGVIVTESRGMLRLWKSATRSAVIGKAPDNFSDCPDNRDAFWISSGRAVWITGNTIHAVNIGTLRKFRMKTDVKFPSVTPVKDGIITTVKSKGYDSYRVRFIRLN